MGNEGCYGPDYVSERAPEKSQLSCETHSKDELGQRPSFSLGESRVEE